MARFAAEVGAATKFSAADFSTAGVREPAGLVFEVFLAAHTGFFYQEGTFRASFLVAMAVVRNLRVATILRSFTFVSARWRSSATW